MIGEYVRIMNPSRFYDGVTDSQTVYGRVTHKEKRRIENSCKKCGQKACVCDWYIVTHLAPPWIGDMAFQIQDLKIVELEEVKVAWIMQV